MDQVRVVGLWGCGAGGLWGSADMRPGRTGTGRGGAEMGGAETGRAETGRADAEDAGNSV